MYIYTYNVYIYIYKYICSSTIVHYLNNVLNNKIMQ